MPQTTTSERPQWGPHLRLLGMAVLWGASWPAGRILALNMPPLAASGLRFVLAVMLLLPWLYFSGGFDAIKRWTLKTWLGMVAAGATGVFGYSSFFLTGLQHLPAGKAALLITLNPVLTLLLAVWIFKERINRTIAFGMLLAAMGAVVVISHGNPLHLLSGAVGVGELLILGCVACWVSYTLIGRAILAGVDALAATTVTAIVGSIMLLTASVLVEGWQGVVAAFHAGHEAWIAMFLMAFGSTSVAYAWYFSGVKMLGAGAASGYITLVPVVGVILSALLLGESIDGSMWVGGAMAIIGTVIMNFGRTLPSPA